MYNPVPLVKRQYKDQVWYDPIWDRHSHWMPKSDQSESSQTSNQPEKDDYPRAS